MSFYEVFGLKKTHIEWSRGHGVFWGFLGLFGVGFQKKKEVPDDPARNHLFDRGFLPPGAGSYLGQ